MKYLFIVLLMFLAGCTLQEQAQWHLRKALEKDPSIIDIQADSSKQINISWEDTTIAIKLKKPFQINTDTIIERDTITNLKDTIEAVTKDETAYARAWEKDGIVSLMAYAHKDTILTLQDSIQVKNKIIEEKTTIIKKQKATIKEKTSLVHKLKNWLVVLASLFALGLIIIFVSKFSSLL